MKTRTIIGFVGLCVAVTTLSFGGSSGQQSPLLKEIVPNLSGYKLVEKWDADIPHAKYIEYVRFFKGATSDRDPFLWVSTVEKIFVVSKKGKILREMKRGGGEEGERIVDISIKGDVLVGLNGDEAGGFEKVFLKNKKGIIVHDLSNDLGGHNDFTLSSFTADGKDLLIGGANGFFVVSTSSGSIKKFPFPYPGYLVSTPDESLWGMNYQDRFGIVTLTGANLMDIPLRKDGGLFEGGGISPSGKRVAALLSENELAVYKLGVNEPVADMRLPFSVKGFPKIEFLDDDTIYYADAYYLWLVSLKPQIKNWIIVPKLNNKSHVHIFDCLDRDHIVVENYLNSVEFLSIYDRNGFLVYKAKPREGWRFDCEGEKMVFWKDGKIKFLNFLKSDVKLLD